MSADPREDTSAGLAVTELTKAYGAAPVLQGVSLRIPAGAVAAVVGPSGCGKTTLLRLIAGFETPDSGTVAVGDREVAGSRWVPPHKRGVGYVAQDGALFPHLSVGQNVAFGLPRRDKDPERIAELLRTVALDPAMATRRPDQLSGGQQQRVSLARALALRPQVMLLDEPFSALDAGLRARTRDIIGGVLRDAGVTTVLVTHDQEEALSFADEVAVMEGGRFRQVGAPEEVYLRPCDLDTARFLGDTVELEGEASGDVALCAVGKVELCEPRQGAVRVVLRPEQLRVGPAVQSTANRVVATAFRGDHVRVTVAVEGAPQPLVLRTSAVRAPAAGDYVEFEVFGAATAFPLGLD